MMRRIKMAGLILLTFFSFNSNVLATDYSTMSTEELSKLRGTMQSTTQADRDAFHNEWMNRVQQMTPEERQRYMGPGKGMGSSSGMGNGMGGHSGSGMGRGMGGNSGGGMGGSGGGSGGGRM